MKSHPAKQLLYYVALPILLCACHRPAQSPPSWTPLFDATLSRWDTYLSFKLYDGYDGSAPKDSLGNAIEPLGLNNDPHHVFTVEMDGNDPVVHVSGEYYGALVSKETYGNYRFRVKVKWGEKKWPPRTHLLRDAGVVYHSFGTPANDYWRSWMEGPELQVMEGHFGDYWNSETTAEDVRVLTPESSMNAVASLTRDFYPLGAGTGHPGFCLRTEDFESPFGEWTQVELVCYGDKSLHLVNGHVVMVLKNSRSVQNGVTTPLVKGKLQLQSEASELYYKDAEIMPLDSLPAEFAKYY